MSKSFSEEFLVRKQRYEYHRSVFNGRSSYSKTDPDATFMRMKEDHMGKGQLKPGYNVQISCEKGFVLSYALFPDTNDTKTLIPHLNMFHSQYGRMPKRIVGDKGYGSFDNYRELERHNIDAYIKYSHWDQEQKKRTKKYRYRWWQFKYDEELSQMTCPEGHLMKDDGPRKRLNYSKTGFDYFTLYKCEYCPECPVKTDCTRREYRTIELNARRRRLQQQAKERLKTEEGWQIYRRRGCEVETVFGQVKSNLGFRRFHTWGKQNVNCEWGLHMIAYNLKNLAAKCVSA